MSSPPGSHSPTGIELELCPAGFRCPAGKAVPCEPGTFSPAGATECSCQNKPGQRSCTSGSTSDSGGGGGGGGIDAPLIGGAAAFAVVGIAVVLIMRRRSAPQVELRLAKIEYPDDIQV